MSQYLIDKIRAGRQRTVECGKYRVIVRRPTDLDMLKLRGNADQETLFRRFVVGWSGFSELDFFGGGTGVEVPFNNDLFCEWIADRPEYWHAITDAIVQAYQDHERQQDDDAKN